jgi:threonine/homoserine/homoserine lactone efflux protein
MLHGSAALFAQGLAFGLVLQVAVGPVCLAVLGEALTHGLRRALAMVLGVALVDGAYMAVGATGIATLLRLDAARHALGLSGALILAAFGLRALLAQSRRGAAPSTAARSAVGGFALGIGLTAGNPLTVLFWTGAFASFIAAGRLHGSADIAVFSLGCLSATLLFLAAVAWTARCLAPHVGDRATQWLGRAIGVVLIALAFRLALTQLLRP